MKRFLIVTLALVGLSYSANAMTLAELRSAERYKLNDSTQTTNNPKWSDTELNRRNNEVQRNISQYTRCIYAQSISTATAEVREYAKPDKCIAIDRVAFLQNSSTDSYKKLEAKTIGGLDRDSSGWEYTTSGLPRYYYERGNVIGFDRPVSSVYASTVAIKINYYKYTDDMDSDTDEPFDSVGCLEVYHDIIVLGVVASCKQDECKWNESSTVQSEYISRINLMMESLNMLPDQRVQRIKIGD